MRPSVLIFPRVRFAPLLALLLLAGCASQALAERRAYLTSFVGGSEAALVRQMGVPTRTFEAGGEKFLAYDTRSVDVVPGFYPSPWFGPGFGPWWGYPYAWSPPAVIARTCETTFEIKAGKVASFSMRGDGCA